MNAPTSASTSSTSSTSSKSLLAQGLGLAVISCGGSAARALLAAGTSAGVEWGPRPAAIVAVGHALTAVVMLGWLSWRVIVRTTRSLGGGSRRQQVLQRCAAVAAGYLGVLSSVPGAGALGTAWRGVVLAWLAWEICQAHGLRLGWGSPTAAAADRMHTWRGAVFSVLACFTGIALVNVLSAGLQIAAIPGLPQQDQLDALGLSSPADGLLAVVGSVAVEDIVLVGALTTLMTAARSPRWAVYGVVTLIEVLIHGYLGLPALGMIAYGVMRVRLYLRYGRVLPLIIGHTVWDLTTTLPSLLHASPLMHTAIVAGVGSGWIIAYTYAERRATVEKEYAAREATRQAGPGITRDLPVAGATDERALE